MPSSKLTYDGRNSCFFDSFVMALFHAKSTWVETVVLGSPPAAAHIRPLVDKAEAIRRDLRELYEKLNDRQFRGALTCSSTRRLFAEYDREYERHFAPARGANVVEWTHTQQEPADVLSMLHKVFRIPDDTLHVVRSARPTGTSCDVERRSFCSLVVGVGDLVESPRVWLDDLLPLRTEKYALEGGGTLDRTSLLVRADFVVVTVVRNYAGERKLRTPVVPAEHVWISARGRLACRSIVLHHGDSTGHGHYTCVVRDDSQGGWFHYDDTRTVLEFIGGFPDVIEWRAREVLGNSVALVYARQEEEEGGVVE